MLITIRSMMFMIGKGMAALGLGGLILWQVAIRSGPLDGVAIVHVSSPNVDVSVDDVQYHVESLLDSPIVCNLSPGVHMVRMIRNGQVLYEEKFTLDLADEIVLVAWEPRSETPAHAAPPNQLHKRGRRPAREGRTRP